MTRGSSAAGVGAELLGSSSVRRRLSLTGDGRDDHCDRRFYDLEWPSVTRRRSPVRVADVIVARLSRADPGAPGRSGRHEGSGPTERLPAEIHLGGRYGCQPGELAHRKEARQDIGNDHGDLGAMLACHGQDEVGRDHESLAQLPGAKTRCIYTSVAKKSRRIFLHRLADDAYGAGAGYVERSGVATECLEKSVAGQALGHG